MDIVSWGRRARAFLRTPKRHVSLGIAAGLAFSLLFLSRRNIYDDELGSFEWIVLPLVRLWSAANAADVHPPGMYALSRGFFLLTDSERWLTVGPLLVLFGGLFALLVQLSSRLRGEGFLLALFVGIAALHPQLLMWGNSIRWYPYWSGLAWLVLALGIVRPRGDLPTPLLCAVIGLLLGAMFYLSYLTIFFAACLLVGWFVRWGPGKRSLVAAAMASGAALAVASFQIAPLVRAHLGHSASQRASIPIAAARLIHGLAIGEAMLPWHPVAAVVGATLLLACVRALRNLARGVVRLDRTDASLLAFVAGMLVLGVVSGIGAKPRSFIVVIPLIAYLLVRIGGARSTLTQRLAVSLAAIAWIGTSMSNLLNRSGTAKAGLSDRADEVVAAIEQAARGEPALIFLHDPSLGYAVNDAIAKKGRRWHVASFYRDHVHGMEAGAAPPAGFVPELMFYVGSYEGSLASRRSFLETAKTCIVGHLERATTVGLSRDPDVALKRRIPGMGDARALPEYRFLVTYGAPRPGTDWSALTRLMKLEHFGCAGAGELSGAMPSATTRSGG